MASIAACEINPIVGYSLDIGEDQENPQRLFIEFIQNSSKCYA